MSASVTAIKYRPVTGFAGMKSRDVTGENIEGHVVSATNTPAAYGLAVVLDSVGAIEAPAGAAAVTGIIFRSWPIQQQTGGMSAGFGAVTPTAGVVDNYMTKGYVTVQIPSTQAAPVVGGVVYVRVQNGTASQPVGGFETVTSADVIALPASQARWASNGAGVNSLGNDVAEVAFGI